MYAPHVECMFLSGLRAAVCAQHAPRLQGMQCACIMHYAYVAILAQPTFLALYLSIQISSNVSLAMPLTINAIMPHQVSHAIVLGQGPTTQKPRVQKRPAGAVMKKPAAGSVTRYYKSTSSIMISGSSIDDDTTLSALASSSRVASQNRAPWGRTLTVRSTEPYELEPGVDYSSAGTPSSTLASEMDEQLRLMGWARS